ncbi:hypothetical protein GGS20DRAFT_566454 [Poronia punctata]|nr:hypothetical protein GGS20DRAFT_566454 [Poronia punctata]
MFPIDPSLLPSLATRKALLVVDAQNDFLAEGGALPSKLPMDLSTRISDLANDFRGRGGEVIWVQSQFQGSRPLADEQILLPDMQGFSAAVASPAGRRVRNTAPATGLIPPTPPEAFLTCNDSPRAPKCVRVGAPGTEMHPVIKQAVGPKDHVLTKSFYSAFKSDELLRLLRVKLVTELFICGSSTGVGVMATAIDAASYGYTITIVDDCCGSQTMTQHRTAIRQITSTTGCDALPAAKVLADMKPKSMTPNTPNTSDRVDHQPWRRPPASRPAGGTSSAVRAKGGDVNAGTSSASELQSSMERLSLNGDHAHHHAAAVGAGNESSTKRQPDALLPPTNQARNSLEEEGSAQVNGRYGAAASKEPSKPPGLSSGPAVPRDARSEDGATLGTCVDPFVSQTGPEQSGKIGRIEWELDAESRLDEGEPLCEGDTKVVYHVLPEPLVHGIYERIKDEIDWQRMSHQGGEVPRLVAVQGVVDVDGSKPVYRHPSDESPPLRPLTPAVDEIRRVIEAKLGHPLNHVLIQLYRHANDYISEHSDKTLDIVRGSYIANVSLGAERTMTLRTKRQRKEPSRTGTGNEQQVSPSTLKRQVQRARLPHNSLFQMGLATNMRWMHSIRPDKRLAKERSPAELAYGGARISLTFRHIGTFLNRDEGRIWGQGATAKSKDEACEVINGQTPAVVSMLRAFGRENQASEFDWEAHYGSGFDVLHITVAARLFLSTDAVVNMRLQMILAELGISYARGSMTASSSQSSPSAGADGHAARARGSMVSGGTAVKYVDNDEAKTVVEGERNIMLYLQKKAPPNPSTALSATNDETLTLERFEQGLGLLSEWQKISSLPTRLRASAVEELLAPWESFAKEGDGFIAGSALSLADFAFWPVLHAIISSLEDGGVRQDRNQVRDGHSDGDEDRARPKRSGKLQIPSLLAYYDRLLAREQISRMLADATRT